MAPVHHQELSWVHFQEKEEEEVEEKEEGEGKKESKGGERKEKTNKGKIPEVGWGGKIPAAYVSFPPL